MSSSEPRESQVMTVSASESQSAGNADSSSRAISRVGANRALSTSEISLVPLAAYRLGLKFGVGVYLSGKAAIVTIQVCSKPKHAKVVMTVPRREGRSCPTSSLTVTLGPGTKVIVGDATGSAGAR